MAALVIFVMTAVVLGSAYLNVLNSYQVAQRSNANEDAIAFARSQLLVISDLATAETGQEFDDGPRHVKWTAEIAPTNTTDLFTVIFTCVVTDPPAGDKTTKETFMLMRPTWSDPTERTSLRQNAANRIAVLQGRQQAQP
ncbi:MAG TPA: hypothetical protein VFE25_04740 [Opitutaceae bacterium]|jgi:hypothetical protein|nr:hypothetical protein [Opitutaceae bacterium]